MKVWIFTGVIVLLLILVIGLAHDNQDKTDSIRTLITERNRAEDALGIVKGFSNACAAELNAHKVQEARSMGLEELAIHQLSTDRKVMADQHAAILRLETMCKEKGIFEQ